MFSLNIFCLNTSTRSASDKFQKLNFFNSALVDPYRTMLALHSKIIRSCSLLEKLSKYLSGMQYVDGIIGNSSSGLIEAPSFHIGTINIGDRQRGRIKAESVIDCNPGEDDIRVSLKKLYSNTFIDKLKSVSSPFGEGGTAEKIVNVIRACSLDNLIKKRFYNIRDH